MPSESPRSGLLYAVIVACNDLLFADLYTAGCCMPHSRPSTSASRTSIGSLDSRMDDFPDSTNAQILSLAFGVGPCADLLFVGLDDDSVCIIDSGILMLLTEDWS